MFFAEKVYFTFPKAIIPDIFGIKFISYKLASNPKSELSTLLIF